jgi:hypothetical protein
MANKDQGNQECKLEGGDTSVQLSLGSHTEFDPSGLWQRCKSGGKGSPNIIKGSVIDKGLGVMTFLTSIPTALAHWVLPGLKATVCRQDA